MRIKASGSHRCYHIDDLKPRSEDDWLEAKLHEHRFRSIDKASNAMESVGWVNLISPAAARFGTDELWREGFLCLGMRIDRKRLPPNALRVRLLEALSAERTRSGVMSLPRARLQEIREALESELLTRTVPSTQLFQVIWDVAAGRLLLSSTSGAANGAFVSLFTRTFGRGPVPALPGLAAERLRLPASHRRRLANATPTWFSGPQPIGDAS